MNSFIYLRNVVTLELIADKCVGCGMCIEVCPHEVFVMNGKHVAIRNRDGCMECGACSRNCPYDALSVQAGVGCAAAVINSMLGRTDATACCCLSNNEDLSCATKDTKCC